MTRSNVRVFLLTVAGLASLLAVTLVAAQSTSTATVEVAVWRNVENPERLHLSTRPADGTWTTHNTPLELTRRGSWDRSSVIAVDVEVPVAGLPGPSWLHVIDGSAGCATLVAYFAEHFPEHISVLGCEAFDVREERVGLRGVLVQSGLHAAFRAFWTETSGISNLNWSVYVIWEPLLLVRERRVVYVGHGAVGARLARHRRDKNIAYYGMGSLLVTWAACLPQAEAGMVQFLAAAYRPYEDRHSSRAEPVSVNLPFHIR